MFKRSNEVAHYKSVSAEIAAAALVNPAGFSGKEVPLPGLMLRALASCQRNRQKTGAGFERVRHEDGHELYAIDPFNSWTPQVVKDAIGRLGTVQAAVLSEAVGRGMVLAQAGFSYVAPGVRPPFHVDEDFAVTMVHSQFSTRFLSIEAERQADAKDPSRVASLRLQDSGLVAVMGESAGDLERDPPAVVSFHTAEETSGIAARRAMLFSYKPAA